MNGWSFEETPDGVWQWCFIDPQGFRETQVSTQTFPTLVECIQDAKRHGYDPDERGPPVWTDFRE